MSGTFTTSTNYNIDGSVAVVTYPAAAGMPAETVAYNLDSTGRPLTMTGQDSYVTGTDYYGWGPAPPDHPRQR